MSQTETEFVLTSAKSCKIYCGTVEGNAGAKIINITDVSTADDIQDEVVFGEFYPKDQNEFANNNTYGNDPSSIYAYKINREEDPFLCVIKVLLPRQTYRIEFFDEEYGEGNLLGQFNFYTVGDYNIPNYYPCYYTVSLFRYNKTYAYETETEEVKLHRLDNAAHTHDTEVLSEIVDQSIVSTYFVDAFKNDCRKNSQLLNGNILTKDCHLLYLGNLVHKSKLTRASLEIVPPNASWLTPPALRSENLTKSGQNEEVEESEPSIEIEGILDTVTNNNIAFVDG